MTFIESPDFWIGLIKIIWINALLSGDNAVVIALAARALPPTQQKAAVIWGASLAVILRIGLTVVAALLLELPYLQILGGLLLLWIGIRLLRNGEDTDSDIHANTGLLAAIRTIVVADLVMSLDNVIGVAAAANGNLILLSLGLAISIPIVVFGSTLIIKIMERMPLLVVAGAGLIGWVAGETVSSDKLLTTVLAGAPWLHYAAAVLGVLLVIGLGQMGVRTQGLPRR